MYILKLKEKRHKMTFAFLYFYIFCNFVGVLFLDFRKAFDVLTMMSSNQNLLKMASQ